MTPVYILLAECDLTGEIVSATYDTEIEAREAAFKAIYGHNQTRCRLIRLDLDDNCEVIRLDYRNVKSSR